MESMMNKRLKKCALLIAIFSTLQASAADQAIVSCKANNSRSSFQKITLVKKTDGLYVNFLNIFAGNQVISQKVIKTTSTGSGLKYLFLVQDDGNSSLVIDENNAAVLNESKNAQDEVGSTIEFLTCKN